MTFAQDIGLGKELDRTFSRLKQRRRAYPVSAKILSFLHMIIKGGDRLTDLHLLEADPRLVGSDADAERSSAEHDGRLGP